MNALFGLGQALLQVLDPERAHNLAIKSLELGLYPRAAGPDDKRLAQRIFGLDFANPLGMAAGFDKNARVPRELLAMGFGFVEVGTLTPRAQSGNATPRIFRSPADGAIINRLGFNNQGQGAALARLRHRPPGIVGINIGAGRNSPDRIADYVSGIERMGAVASYFTVNISSPNTPGLRDLQAPEALDLLLKRVLSARGALASKPPLLVKLAPDLADADLPEVVEVIAANGVDGIVVSNTTLARDGLEDAAFGDPLRPGGRPAEELQRGRGHRHRHAPHPGRPDVRQADRAVHRPAHQQGDPGGLRGRLGDQPLRRPRLSLNPPMGSPSLARPLTVGAVVL